MTAPDRLVATLVANWGRLPFERRADGLTDDAWTMEELFQNAA